MRFSVEVEGANQIGGVFAALSLAARERVEQVVVHASKEIRKEARRRVPVRSGNFRKRIRTKYSKDGLTGSTAAFTRGGRPHPLSHLLEFGTAPHTIKSETKKAIAIKGSGGEGPVQFAAKIDHPGSVARPWLFPSFEAAKGQYMGWLREALNQAGRDAARAWTAKATTAAGKRQRRIHRRRGVEG